MAAIYRFLESWHIYNYDYSRPGVMVDMFVCARMQQCIYFLHRLRSFGASSQIISLFSESVIQSVVLCCRTACLWNTNSNLRKDYWPTCGKQLTARACSDFANISSDPSHVLHYVICFMVMTFGCALCVYDACLRMQKWISVDHIVSHCSTQTNSEVDVHTLASDYATNLASCTVQQNAMNLEHRKLQDATTTLSLLPLSSRISTCSNRRITFLHAQT